MPRVVFLPAGMDIDCEADETIFAAARRSAISVPTACVGKATCGLCRVRVVEGEENLSPLNADERRHLGNVYFINKLRLACQTRVLGGQVTVEVPPAAGKRRG